jgi:hypothetical protein
MSEIIDLEKLYRDEQRRWLREAAPKRSFRDRLIGSVAYWIVLVRWNTSSVEDLSRFLRNTLRTKYVSVIYFLLLS